MKILIDADSCPVTGIAADVAFDNSISCLIICDTGHSIDIERSETIVVDKGKDSADFRIMNLLQSGDIVITHDIKLALVCISMGAYVLDHDGSRFDERSRAKMQAKSAKRTTLDDIKFEDSLSDLVWEIMLEDYNQSTA